MSKTVRVRIAVAVFPDGSWKASGSRYPGATMTQQEHDDSDLKWVRDHCTDDGDPLSGEHCYFVEADLPVPETTVVPGEVSEAS